MKARSIFEKICPSCMATLATDARQCACGYDFAQDQSATGLSSEEIRLKAEELYENYLAARADQAAEAVKTAQVLFARDPANVDKSNGVTEAIREARQAQEALQAQTARIAEMRQSLRLAVPAPTSITAVTAVPSPMAAALKTRPAPKPAGKPVPARATRKAITSVATVVVATTKRAANAQVPSAPKNHAAATPAKSAIKAPTQSATPNKTFRKVQAAKAEKILRANHAAEPVAPAIAEKLPATPATGIKAPQTPPIAAAPVKTAPRLYAASDKKDCPNCTASVAMNATRCRCGYEFSSSEQHIPALTMSEEERAAFAKLFT